MWLPFIRELLSQGDLQLIFVPGKSLAILMVLKTLIWQDEVKDWIIPPDYDHVEAEARHLIREADMDEVRVAKL